MNTSRKHSQSATEPKLLPVHLDEFDLAAEKEAKALRKIPSWRTRPAPQNDLIALVKDNAKATKAA